MKGFSRKVEKVVGHYGEIFCPESIQYVDESIDVVILEVKLNSDYDSSDAQELLRKIDMLVREFVQVD